MTHSVENIKRTDMYMTIVKFPKKICFLELSSTNFDACEIIKTNKNTKVEIISEHI